MYALLCWSMGIVWTSCPTASRQVVTNPLALFGHGAVTTAALLTLAGGSWQLRPRRAVLVARV
jgi:hypothetical protein